MIAKARRVHFFIAALSAKEHIELGQYDDARCVEASIDCADPHRRALLRSVINKYGQEHWFQLRADCARLLMELAKQAYECGGGALRILPEAVCARSSSARGA